MKPTTNVRTRSQKSETIRGQGPNWILVAGGALLSSIFIHLGYKLKQALEARQPNLHGSDNGNSADRKRSGSRHSHSVIYTYGPVEDGCFNCNSATEHMDEIKSSSNDQVMTEPEASLSLVTYTAPEYSRENSVVWAASPERLELPPKPSHHSNCLESPCASDSGSDVFMKREVIQKLRQQLKKRDDMILEMQDQIVELQNVLSRQVSQTDHLQSELESANRAVFDSERELQRLRKAIANRCSGHTEFNGRNLPSEVNNGHANGYANGDINLKTSEKWKGDGEKIEMLKSEIGELKEVLEGKEFLMRSYKEQKSELSIKIRELQERLDSQLPNIL